MSYSIRAMRNDSSEVVGYVLVPDNIAPEDDGAVLEFADIEKAVQTLSILNGAPLIPSLEATAEKVLAGMMANPNIVEGLSFMRGEHQQAAMADIAMEIANVFHAKIEKGRTAARDQIENLPRD